MEHSRAALPESTYLLRIGELAYTVSYMEWTVLGDLCRLGPRLPASLVLAELEPGMTSEIARKLKLAIPQVTDEFIKTYLVTVYRSLFGAAVLRNDVLHARPATHPDGSQRLSRAEVVDRKTTGHRFWIDDEWFDAAFRKLNDLMADVSAARPPLT